MSESKSGWFWRDEPEGDIDNLFRPPVKEPPKQEYFMGERQSLAAEFSSPHDAILAGLHPRPAPPPEEEQPTPAIRDDRPIRTMGHGEIVSPVFDPGQRKRNHQPKNFNVKEVIADPYSGHQLGTLSLPTRVVTAKAYHPLSEAAIKNEELWTNLSQVLQLQDQISYLHIAMEGISQKSDDHTKKSGVPAARRTWTEDSALDDERIDNNHELDDEERRNKEREEEFTRLADQLESRKDGMTNIMNKVQAFLLSFHPETDHLQLDELSKAITKFHTLQAPKIEFPSSRSNSIPISVGDQSRANSLDRERAFPFSPLAKSFSEPPGTPKTPASPGPLLINTLNLGKQTHAVESPASGLMGSPKRVPSIP
jgi:hypothetical protein